MSPAQTGLNEGTGWGRPRKAGPRNLLMKEKLRLRYQDSPRTLGGHGVEVSTVLRSLWGHKGGRVLTVRKTQAAVDDACSLRTAKHHADRLFLPGNIEVVNLRADCSTIQRSL